jgi:hypothetical protein
MMASIMVDRSADPVREKCPHTLRRSDRRDRREHQGVGLDDAAAGAEDPGASNDESAPNLTFGGASIDDRRGFHGRRRRFSAVLA